MQNLIQIQLKDGIQVVDSRLVAKGLNIKHQNLIETIKKYQDKLEKLGLLTFETEAVKEEGARGTKYHQFCYLNELQCNFVVTLSRNTEAVVDFKLSLVVAFDKAKKEVALLSEVLEESDDYLAKKRAYYEKQGYSTGWIDKRLQSIEIRKELEAEWRKRGITEAKQFAALTALISKGAFGLTPTEHKKLKGLRHQNLRDHMTRIELIFMMLGEEATHDFVEQDDAQNFEAHKASANKGGKVANDARLIYESQTGKKVVSAQNFLPENRKKYVKSPQ